MNEKFTAYIRTAAPIIAGAIIGFFATKGLDIQGASELLIITITGAFQIVWYVAARLIGKKFPKVEALMLGSEKTPKY